MLTTKLQTDIKRGTVLEELVKIKLEAKGFHCTHVPGNFKYFDFAISKGPLVSKVEVKFDAMSDKTGRYCIELRWLDHTIASLLIIGTPLEAWVISVDEVKKLVAECNDFRQTGDRQDNISALISKPALIARATRFI